MRFRTLAVTLAALAFAAPALAQTITQPWSGDNSLCSVTQWVGPVKVTIDYSSPDVHAPNGEDRAGKIWGGLVPYGLHELDFGGCKECPWRAGANQNTVFTTSHDLKVEGQPLAAGAYGLFMIADPNEWTVIFSKNHTSWGSYSYDPKEDALRVKVKPAKSEYREWLTYDFTDRQPAKATFALRWENLEVPVKIEVENVADLYVAQMKRELRNRDGFSWINWVAAAEYCLDHNTHLADGLWFAERAVSWEGIGVANFQTLSVLARAQLANGKKDEAAKTVARALGPAETSVFQMHGFGRALQGQNEHRLAMSVFEENAKRHPNTWPVGLGLARGYAGLGQNAKAVAAAKKALAQAPDEPNRKNIENLIKTWEGAPGK